MKSGNWSCEDYRHYLATGQKPKDVKPETLSDFDPSPLSPKANKYGAKKITIDGWKFDSEVEAARYLFLKADPEVLYVDVHPVLTLPGGIRFKADFIAWPLDSHESARVEDVKGMRPSTDFWRLKQMFDFHHPLRPLVVVRRVKGQWILVVDKADWQETKGQSR